MRGLDDLDGLRRHGMSVTRDDEPFAGAPRPAPCLLEGGGHAGGSLAGAEDDGSALGLFRQAALELSVRKRGFQGRIEKCVEDIGIVWHGVTLRQKSHA